MKKSGVKELNIAPSTFYIYNDKVVLFEVLSTQAITRMAKPSTFMCFERMIGKGVNEGENFLKI